MSQRSGAILRLITYKCDADLIELFDEDDNGGNGDEYLEGIAREAGFTNNAEHYISTFGKEDGGLSEDEIGKVIQRAYQNGCYDSLVYEVLFSDHHPTTVAVAYTTCI